MTVVKKKIIRKKGIKKPIAKKVSQIKLEVKKEDLPKIIPAVLNDALPEKGRVHASPGKLTAVSCRPKTNF